MIGPTLPSTTIGPRPPRRPAAAVATLLLCGPWLAADSRSVAPADNAFAPPAGGRSAQGATAADRRIAGPHNSAPRGGAETDAPRDATASLDELQAAFQQVIERVAPSVVGLRAYRRHVALPAGDAATDPRRAWEQYVVVNGSGTVIHADGLILTNEHVVQGADRLDVILHDGEIVSGALVAADPRGDLAVIRVPRHLLAPAEPCDFAQVARGQWTLALGNPFGLGGDGKLSVSVGVIANLGRRLPGLGEADDRLYTNMIQTTAAIHPGNSGGPLLNLRGQLIGIVTAMHTRAAADDGVGFALPMTPRQWERVQRLARGERIEYGYIGLAVRPATPHEQQAAALEPGVGAVVESVEPDGPGAQAGVQSGDLIVRFNRQTVSDVIPLTELVGQAAVGAEALLELLRAGQRHTLSVRVEARDLARVSWMRGGAILWRGMRLAELAPQPREPQRTDPTGGGVVVIDVQHDSPAAHLPIERGDVIEEIEGRPVGTIEVLQARVRSRKDALRIRLRGRGEVVLPP